MHQKPCRIKLESYNAQHSHMDDGFDGSHGEVIQFQLEKSFENTKKKLIDIFIDMTFYIVYMFHCSKSKSNIRTRIFHIQFEFSVAPF